MTTSTETKDIFAALAKCQAVIEGALKDKTNPAFKSKYADLSSVVDAARGPLSANGLALTIGLIGTADGVALEALLAHSSGEWIKYDPFNVLVTKRDAQGQGSAITYGRRYLTMSILGIPAEDDDGNAASAPKPAARPEPKPEPKPAQKTHRERVIEFVDANKANLTAEQLGEIKKGLAHAGTSDAMLDDVLAEAKGYLNGNSSAEDFARVFDGEVVA